MLRIPGALSFILLLLIFSSCTTTVKFPANRFSSPETKGAGSFGYDLAWTGVNEVSMIDNYKAAAPLSHTDSKVKKGRTLNNHIGLGFLDFLDIDLSAGLGTPLQFGVKMQFLGEPEASAKGGNISLAARIGYGLFAHTSEIDKKHVSGESRNVTVESNLTDADFTIGWRILDPLLVWGGYYVANYLIRSEVRGGIVDNYEAKGTQKAWHLGVGFKAGFFNTKLEVAHVKHVLKTTDIKETDDWHAGLTVGVFF